MTSYVDAHSLTIWPSQRANISFYLSAESFSKDWTERLEYLNNYCTGNAELYTILTASGSVQLGDPKMAEFRKFLKLVSIVGDPSFDEKSLVFLLGILSFVQLSPINPWDIDSNYQ